MPVWWGPGCCRWCSEVAAPGRRLLSHRWCPETWASLPPSHATVCSCAGLAGSSRNIGHRSQFMLWRTLYIKNTFDTQNNEIYTIYYASKNLSHFTHYYTSYLTHYTNNKKVTLRTWHITHLTKSCTTHLTRTCKSLLWFSQRSCKKRRIGFMMEICWDIFLDSLSIFGRSFSSTWPWCDRFWGNQWEIKVAAWGTRFGHKVGQIGHKWDKSGWHRTSLYDCPQKLWKKIDDWLHFTFLCKLEKQRI